MSDYLPNLADAGSNNDISDASHLNLYQTNTANFNVETNILTYIVPDGITLNIDTVEVWGNYFGEWFIRINGTQVGGTNISSAERSKTLDYTAAPIAANSEDTVTISFQHQYTGAVLAKANLMGRID